MIPKASILCLVLLSACAAAPTPRPLDPRTAWTEKTRAIQTSWGRQELEEFLDPAARLDGGGFSVGSGPLTFYDLYSLDESFALYVVWTDQDTRHGIRSTEVVAFSDLRGRIDPAQVDGVTAIQQSPSALRGLDFDPRRLIRGVNALQTLGRERALEALRTYDRLARGLSLEERVKYQVDEYRILPLVRLLFEGPARPFVLGEGDFAAPAGDAWPLFPIVLVRGIPFMMISGYSLDGKPQRAAEHLRPDLGPLRPPLAPAVSTLEAADELTDSPAWKALRLGPGNEGRKRWQVRRQALRAVGAVFAPRPDETTNDCCVDPTEPQWRATVGRAASSGLLWSPELQDFILGR